jgi:hypothetical protein
MIFVFRGGGVLNVCVCVDFFYNFGLKYFSFYEEFSKVS